MRTYQQEGVVMILEEDEPIAIVRANGSTKYYKLIEMSFKDHVEFLGADQVQK